MTVKRFNALTLPQQCYYTVKCSVYLTTINEQGLSIDLYQAPNFYVEIFYKLGSTDCCMAKGFTHTNGLNKYLKNISIAELFC